MRGHTLITVPLAPQMAYVPLRATHNGKRAAPTVPAAASSTGVATVLSSIDEAQMREVDRAARGFLLGGERRATMHGV